MLPFTRRHKPVPATSQDRSPQPQHPARQQLPQGLQLPLLDKQQPSAADRLAPHQKTKLKQFTFFKTETPHLPHLYLEALVFNDKANLWILFTQMRSVDTHRLHLPCSWKSHTADNLNKLLPSTTITDTSAATCTPETKDPHPSLPPSCPVSMTMTTPTHTHYALGLKYYKQNQKNIKTTGRVPVDTHLFIWCYLDAKALLRASYATCKTLKLACYSLYSEIW